LLILTFERLLVLLLGPGRQGFTHPLEFHLDVVLAGEGVELGGDIVLLGSRDVVEGT
jgi:hypothetical protein